MEACFAANHSLVFKKVLLDALTKQRAEVEVVLTAWIVADPFAEGINGPLRMVSAQTCGGYCEELTTILAQQWSRASGKHL